MDFNKQMHEWIETIKNSGIDGCITGSCMLDVDFNDWMVKPDIDMFTYSEREMIRAVTIMIEKYGFKFGAEDTWRSAAQESKKFDWVMEGKRNKGGYTGTPLSTIKLNKDGIVLNISCKQYKRNVAEVVNDFDMTIIMKGWDISGGFMYDMTTQWGDKNIAIPNKLRKVAVDVLTVAYWTRQFDRVIKYWDRGFDTRPMAKFYLEQIDDVLKQGNLWTSEGSEEFFNKFAGEFDETKKRIELWLEDKEDL